LLIKYNFFIENFIIFIIIFVQNSLT